MFLDDCDASAWKRIGQASADQAEIETLQGTCASARSVHDPARLSS